VNEGAGLSTVTAAISDYSFGAMRRGEMVWNDLEHSQLPSGKLAIRKLALLTDGGEGAECFALRDSFQAEIECVQSLPLGKCEFLLNIMQASGRELLTTRYTFNFSAKIGVRVHKLTCKIPQGLINVGTYCMSIALIDPDNSEDFRVLTEGIFFDIIAGDAKIPMNTIFAEYPINLDLAWSKEVV
jgi:hypothetical protein